MDSAQIDILLKKIKESNHDAFNRLFMEYYPQVKAFLFGFIKNMDDFGKVNDIYASYFTGDFPARSCVEVARLPKDLLIEVEVIALKN